MRQKLFFATIALLYCTITFAQSKVQFPFAEKSNRDSVTANLKKMVTETISLPVAEGTYKKWSGAYWAMELMLYRPVGYEFIIPEQINSLPEFSAEFQRSFLEMLYTLYAKQFANNIKPIWPKLAGNKVKAMALEYMALADEFPLIEISSSFYKSDYYTLYKKKWENNKGLLPSKKEFLNKAFLPGQIVVCSFQSVDRDKPGYLMIRNAAGKWVTDKKGKPLKFTQLARSINNLPYYLTNGNTPQGLFKITGIDTAENNWIGPTTNLQMLMPFEDSFNHFFGTDTAYHSFYQSLLGPLKKYTSLQESYEAGKIGRSQIIAHGTTIPTTFYKSQKYYPCTPSLGCLCSPEIWNEKGERELSVQEEWIKVFKILHPVPQYLIVAEVRDL